MEERIGGEGVALVGPAWGGPSRALPAVAVVVHQVQRAAARRHCVHLRIGCAASDGDGEAITSELPLVTRAVPVIAGHEDL